MVSLAENARIPVDNPATHLELTMIHEAMILEYSARHLALIEWAAALKLFNYSCIGLALFFPWGIARRRRLARAARRRSGADRQARARRLRAGADRDAVGEDAHLPRARVPRHGVPARGARRCSSISCSAAESRMTGIPLYAQLINLLAALLLLLAFAMLTQRRVLSLDRPVRRAGRWRSALSTAIVAYATRPAASVLRRRRSRSRSRWCCCRGCCTG